MGAGLGWRANRGVRVFAAATLLASVVGTPAEATESTLLVAQDIRSGYSRSLFRHWVDEDKDGCNTRAEVLIAEATAMPKQGMKCVLTGGRWISPYDGKVHRVASALEIDHLVPLSEAWRSGAATWDAKQRERFANDLDFAPSLVAVTATLNRSKGGRDVTDWRPARNVCGYVKNWLDVKIRWSLTVDRTEAATLVKYISTCGLPTVTFKELTEPTPGVSPSWTTPDNGPPESQTPSPGSPSASPPPSGTPTQSPSSTPTIQTGITPGSFCSPAGARGISAVGTSYTCKTSAMDARNRWRK
jgi:hypothetical protein